MPVFELEESDYAGPIEDDSIFEAEVISVKLQTAPFKDKETGADIVQVEFKVIIDEPDSPWDSQNVYGKTSTKFNTHPDCVLEGTTVLPVGSLLGATKAFYEGSVVDLVIGSGERLTVTMNHPVLTQRGWVPASEVREKDQIVNYLRADASVAGEHFDNMQTSVEDLFDSLRTTGSSASVPATASHFHGDGEFCKGDINVVSLDSQLSYGFEVPAFKKGHNKVLVGAVRGSEGFDGVGASDAAGGSILLASSGGVGGTRIGGIVPASANGNSTVSKQISNDASADTEMLSTLRESFALGVELAQVLKVNVRSWSGHVYNLFTTSGTYFANQVLVHNCKLRNWSQAILATELPAGYQLDTDLLVGNKCRIVVGAREYVDKEGNDKTANFIKDVMPSRSAVTEDEAPF